MSDSTANIKTVPEPEDIVEFNPSDEQGEPKPGKGKATAGPGQGVSVYFHIERKLILGLHRVKSQVDC